MSKENEEKTNGSICQRSITIPMVEEIVPFSNRLASELDLSSDFIQQVIKLQEKEDVQSQSASSI